MDMQVAFGPQVKINTFIKICKMNNHIQLQRKHNIWFFILLIASTTMAMTHSIYVFIAAGIICSTKAIIFIAHSLKFISNSKTPLGVRRMNILLLSIGIIMILLIVLVYILKRDLLN
jgi:hypothetical protein